MALWETAINKVKRKFNGCLIFEVLHTGMWYPRSIKTPVNVSILLSFSKCNTGVVLGGKGGGGDDSKHTLTRAHMQIKAINSLWWSETSRRKQSVPLPWKPLSPRRAERDGKTQRANEMGREWQKNSYRQTDGHLCFYTSAFPWKAGVHNIMFKGILWLVEEGSMIYWSFAAGDGGKFANYRSHIVPHRGAVKYQS